MGRPARKQMDYQGDPDSGFVRITAKILRNSKDAVQVNDGVSAKWVPKRLIRDQRAINPVGHVSQIEVAAWFARKEALV